MNETIPVKDALRLIELALAQTEGFDGMGCCANCNLARATMRPMLDLVRLRVGFAFGPRESIGSHEAVYPPLAALRDHYSAVRPDWRER